LIIYASPLLHLAKTWENATLSMYIDDGNIFVHAPAYCILARQLCTFYTTCHNWCRQVGLIIEPEKMEVMFLTR
jgi:hypothetical protein